MEVSDVTVTLLLSPADDRGNPREVQPTLYIGNHTRLVPYFHLAGDDKSGTDTISYTCSFESEGDV